LVTRHAGIRTPVSAPRLEAALPRERACLQREYSYAGSDLENLQKIARKNVTVPLIK